MDPWFCMLVAVFILCHLSQVDKAQGNGDFNSPSFNFDLPRMNLHRPRLLCPTEGVPLTYINLGKSYERNAVARVGLMGCDLREKVLISPERRFPAVDAWNFTDLRRHVPESVEAEIAGKSSDLAGTTLQSYATRNGARPGELALFISHVLAATEVDSEYSVVMEDDFDSHVSDLHLQNFKEFLDYASAHDPEWNLVHLFSNYPKGAGERAWRTQHEGRLFTWPLYGRPSYGTVGMVWSKRGKARLRELFMDGERDAARVHCNSTAGRWCVSDIALRKIGHVYWASPGWAVNQIAEATTGVRGETGTRTRKWLNHQSSGSIALSSVYYDAELYQYAMAAFAERLGPKETDYLSAAVLQKIPKAKPVNGKALGRNLALRRLVLSVDEIWRKSRSNDNVQKRLFKRAQQLKKFAKQRQAIGWKALKA